MVRWNGTGVAFNSALYFGNRLLLCPVPENARFKFRQPAFLLLFLVSALIACWVSVLRRRAEAALKRVRDDLEARVEERTADLRRASEGLKAEIAERKRSQ